MSRIWEKELWSYSHSDLLIMLFIECFGKNVYIDGELVGYIAPEGDMFANGHKFGELSHDGEIYIQGEYVGYIEDNNDIYIRDNVAGYVSPSNDLCFDSKALSKNI